jgi:hypothetical protein
MANKTVHYDYLIIGSRQAGKKVLVIEKRLYLGGNVYCEIEIILKWSTNNESYNNNSCH